MKHHLEIGGRMRITEEGATTTFTFDDVGTGRVCGGCTLCCRLLPVQTLAKPAGVRCQHLRYSKGCSIYARRPADCRTWSCRWLADATTAGLPRPDRAHYVIDMTWDSIVLRYDASGHVRRVGMLQVWVDPDFPDAHRAPNLRAYIEMVAERFRAGTLVRWGSSKVLALFAPAISDDKRWHEIADGVMIDREPGDLSSGPLHEAAGGVPIDG